MSEKNELIDKDEFVDLCHMSPLESDKVKEGKRLKILTPNKLLTRLPILLAQNRNRKQFKLIKKRNQTKNVSFVSTQQNYQKSLQ